MLSGILGQAVGDGVLPGSALRQVRLPRSQRARQATRDHRRALTRAERDAVVAHAYALANVPSLNPRTVRKRWATADLVAVLAATGMRIEEARSLRWEHVDLDARTVDIPCTKSTASNRRVTIPGWLAGRLLARTERCGKAGRVLSSPAHLNDPERAWDQANSAKAVRAVLDSAGHDWAIPHTFRRTVASLLHDAKVPVVKIADQLGHSDPSMTASVYLGRDPFGERPDVADLL